MGAVSLAALMTLCTNLLPSPTTSGTCRPQSVRLVHKYYFQKGHF
jgi:hypothetical protein